ncbi:MAG: amidohydrolase family protein [Granulosicoccus sp.]
MSEFDVMFSNATVIDGSGAERYSAHVYVKGDSIADIERLEGNSAVSGHSASRTIDASGKVLAPGFIDAHTHDDLLLLKSPHMEPKTTQGVTTVVTGNCGISLAPMQSRKLVPPFDLIGDEHDFAYPSVDDYASRLDDQPASLNSVMLTGHASLRLEAMDDLQRGATAKEIQTMRKRLEGALQHGAIGMSTGLAYPTAVHAPTSEVTELAAVLNDYGAIYTSHMRNEEDQLLESVEETLQIGRDANVPVVISHHKACGRKNWGKTRESIGMIEAARKTQRVDLDVYPYTASSTVLLPDFVARSERVTITWSKSAPECSGRDLGELCREWQIDVASAIERLNPAGAIYHQMDDDDLHRVMQYGPSMIGSDGLPKDERPHPRLWGTFPRVLGYYCRDLQLFTLEQAIEKMTARPAEVFGLERRGQIRTGWHADLVLFDANTIIDRATYESPTEPSVGVEMVMVNGAAVLQNGQITENRPGRFLRHRHAA